MFSAVILRSICHGKNVAGSFVKEYCASVLSKRQTQNSGNISNNIVCTGKKENMNTCGFFLCGMVYTTYEHISHIIDTDIQNPS
jgi:hypothetical protein